MVRILRGRRRAVPMVAAAVAGAAGLAAAGVFAVLPSEAAVPTNRVTNPSMEALQGKNPTGWAPRASGTSVRVQQVVTGGAAAGQRFVRTTISGHRSGSAWWQPAGTAVAPGTVLAYAETYRSSGPSAFALAVTDTAGRTTLRPLGGAAVAARWTRSTLRITVPAEARAVSVVHQLSGNGRLDQDAVSLTVSSPAPTPPVRPTAPPTRGVAGATGGLVSVTFDDGWLNQYQNAFPAMKARGIPGTYYLISSYLGAPQYMSVPQAKTLQAAGHEIGSHTVTHANIPQVPLVAAEQELAASKAALEANFGPVVDLAFPYGAHSPEAEALAAKYYTTARSTDGGLNAPGAYNRYALTIGYVFNTTPQSQVAQWLADARATNTWLILCYHGVEDGKPADTYTIDVQGFVGHMDLIKKSGIRAVTVKAGYALTS